jgi:hypothetical protein
VCVWGGGGGACERSSAVRVCAFAHVKGEGSHLSSEYFAAQHEREDKIVLLEQASRDVRVDRLGRVVDDACQSCLEVVGLGRLVDAENKQVLEVCEGIPGGIVCVRV